MVYGQELGSPVGPAVVDSAVPALCFVETPVILSSEAVHGHATVMGSTPLVVLPFNLTAIALAPVTRDALFAYRLPAI